MSERRLGALPPAQYTYQMGMSPTQIASVEAEFERRLAELDTIALSALEDREGYLAEQVKAIILCVTEKKPDLLRQTFDALRDELVARIKVSLV